MSGTSRALEPNLPLGSVTVVNPGNWARRPHELAQLLAAFSIRPQGQRVIPDPSGRPSESTLALTDPSFWSSHVAELGDAIFGESTVRALNTNGPTAGGVGAMAETSGRLTWTVEEAAAVLGVSRAFAYDAVRRGEIPAIKIGRRILVPRSGLSQLLESSGSSAKEPGEGGQAQD